MNTVMKIHIQEMDIELEAKFMRSGHAYDCFRQDVDPVLKSKLEEFSILGYATINEDDLWKYLVKKKWRKPKENIHLYELVQDIMSVKVGDYMSYASVEAFKLSEFSFDDEENRKELLK